MMAWTMVQSMAHDVASRLGMVLGINKDISLGINDGITLGFGNDLEFAKRHGLVHGLVGSALHLEIAKAPTMVLRRIKTWHIVWCARVAVYHIVQTKHAYLTVIST